MIDEYWTWQFYGYHSDDLAPKSHKSIVARCDECCKYRVLMMQKYRDLCHPCAQKARPPPTDEARRNISIALTGLKRKPHSEKTKRLISESNMGEKNHFFGEHHTDKAKQVVSELMTGRIATFETRRKLSIVRQGVSDEEWCGFVKSKDYCHLFNEELKDMVRAKYDYKCFICDTDQNDNVDKNGRCIKLAVHHVDRNKAQGCEGIKWKLVPLCMHCHPGSHYDPTKSRLEYLLNVENV